MRILSTFLTLTLLPLCSSMAHASIVVGTPTTANCNPFQCPPPKIGTQNRYMQIYDASLFSEAMSITSIEFYKTSPDANLMGFNYQITLSTTSSSSTSYSLEHDQNTGLDAALFGSGSFSPTTGNSFYFLGDDFFYNPGQGNLLFDIVMSNFEGADLSLPRSIQMSFDPGMIRILDGTTGCSPNSPCGLVTGFNTISEVPVPAAVWLFGSGLIGLISFAIRKQR